MSELPGGLGGFAAGDLSFAADDGLTRVRLEEKHEVDEQALDEKLVPPEGAPVASWLLARLTHLSQGSLELHDETVEICEGGVYVVDFVVRWNGIPAGKIQLQAGRIGVALLGMVSPQAAHVVEAFVGAVQAEPEEVAACAVRARDPAWPEGEVCTYGYDGTRYL